MKKTKEEIEAMREGGKLLSRILREVGEKAVPGVSTAFLNEEAERLIRQCGVKPVFRGYKPSWAVSAYPAVICTSMNDEVVHAIPSPERILKDGDLLGLDLAIWHKGLCVDSAVTMGVGTITPQAQKLIDVTRQSLAEGIAAVKAGARVGDIGHAVQAHVEQNGFSVVRDLAGHGVGHAMHEEPTVLNFGKKGTGDVLEEGMTIAIEPMVNMGGWKVKVDGDGWTIRTADNSLSAHFEHTVLVTKDGCEVLTKE